MSWGRKQARAAAVAAPGRNTPIPRKRSQPSDIPVALARQEARLQAITDAKAEIERRAAERQAAEMAVYEAKVAAREQKLQENRQGRGGHLRSAIRFLRAYW